MVTITLGGVYFVLVCVFGTLSAAMIAVHTAWSFSSLILGFVISYYAERSIIRKKQVEQLKMNAFQQIEQNLEQFRDPRITNIRKPPDRPFCWIPQWLMKKQNLLSKYR